MPRRFALVLLALLVLLLVALWGARAVTERRTARRSVSAVPTVRPTPVVPPTPIPPQRVALFFESGEDEKLHPEARDIPASADSVSLLRAIASAVLEGPRRPDLLKPFPEGWTLRAAFRMKDGLAIVDLAAPPVPPPAEGEASAPPVRWETGTHEEENAAQALLLSITKNIPDVTRIVITVGGEPVETLAGHLDLSHPLRPDPARAVDEPALVPPTPPPATPTETPNPNPTPPTPTPAPLPTKRPTRTPRPPPATADRAGEAV